MNILQYAYRLFPKYILRNKERFVFNEKINDLMKITGLSRKQVLAYTSILKSSLDDLTNFYIYLGRFPTAEEDIMICEFGFYIWYSCLGIPSIAYSVGLSIVKAGERVVLLGKVMKKKNDSISPFILTHKKQRIKRKAISNKRFYTERRSRNNIGTRCSRNNFINKHNQ